MSTSKASTPKTPKIDATDHIKFLVACIGNSTNGRPDFTAVAEELGIVTKGAAQKRYERLLEAHGVSANKTPKSSATVGDCEAATPSPAATPTPASRKRRAPAPPGSNKKSKLAKAVAKKAESVKEEDDTEGSALSDASEDLVDPKEEI